MEGGSMRFRVLLSKSSLISRRDPYWAHRLHTLRPLQVHVPWSRLVLLGIVSPVFPVQHHSPSAGMIGLMASSRGGDAKSEWHESAEQLDLLGLAPIIIG